MRNAGDLADCAHRTISSVRHEQETRYIHTDKRGCPSPTPSCSGLCDHAKSFAMSPKSFLARFGLSAGTGDNSNTQPRYPKRSDRSEGGSYHQEPRNEPPRSTSSASIRHTTVRRMSLVLRTDSQEKPVPRTSSAPGLLTNH